MDKIRQMNSCTLRERQGTSIAAVLGQLEEALQELPAGRKEAYLEAVRRAPWLIPIESPPLRFLRFACFRVVEAAHRLAFYWESRLKIFGVERAFLPLTLSGEGALNQRDILLLKSGHFEFLPSDDAGRTVLYTNLSRPLDASPETCLRVAFYAWSVVSENERSQEDGHVAVVGLLSPQLELLFKQCEEMVSAALPVRVKDTYLLCCCCPGEMGETDSLDFFMSAMPSALEATCMENLTEKREIIQLANTREELADKMEPFGFPKAALPKAVGGALSSKNFDKWLSQRRTAEIDRFALKRAPIVKADPAGYPAGYPAGDPAGYPAGDPAGDPAGHPAGEQGDPTTTREGASNPFDNVSMPLKEGKCYKETPVFDATAALSEKHHSPKNSHVVEHPSPVHKLRQGLEEALNRIPREEKRSYCEALERVPCLVRNDPDPVSFLQCEKNDVDATARRVVRFWKLRRELFADRAFLPMDQTGSGALTQADLEVLRTGWVQMLPPDEIGRTAICHQRSALSPALLKGNWTLRCKRCMFYITCMASESETTRQHGHLLLRLVNVDALLLQPENEAYRFYNNNFPSRPASGHTLISHDAATSKLVHETIVPSILKSCGKELKIPRYVYTGVSGRELADKLRQHGFSRECLPPSMGGTWTKDDFRLWQKGRVALEKERFNGWLLAKMPPGK